MSAFKWKDQNLFEITSLAFRPINDLVFMAFRAFVEIFRIVCNKIRRFFGDGVSDFLRTILKV
jgi:hypothetical protein